MMMYHDLLLLIHPYDLIYNHPCHNCHLFKVIPKLCLFPLNLNHHRNLDLLVIPILLSIINIFLLLLLII